LTPKDTLLLELLRPRSAHNRCRYNALYKLALLTYLLTYLRGPVVKKSPIYTFLVVV